MLLIRRRPFYKNKRTFYPTSNKGFLLNILNTIELKDGSVLIPKQTELHIYNNIFEQNKTLGCAYAKDIVTNLNNSNPKNKVSLYFDKNIFSDCELIEEEKCIMYSPAYTGSNYWKKVAGMVDPDNGNFALAKDSFAVEKGYSGNNNIKPPSFDYFENQRVFDGDLDGTPIIDIGAVEYVYNNNYYLSTDIRGDGFGMIVSTSQYLTDFLTEFPDKKGFNYYYSDKVQILAYADKFSKFVKWEGDCNTCNNPSPQPICNINLKEGENVHCVAVFEKDSFKLTLEKDTAYGKVFIGSFYNECKFKKNGDKYVCEVELGKYENIDLFTLKETYITENGSTISFDSWEGDCAKCKKDYKCSIFLYKNKTCSLKFASFNDNLAQFDNGSSDSDGGGCSFGTTNSLLLWLLVLISVLSQRVYIKKQ